MLIMIGTKMKALETSTQASTWTIATTNQSKGYYPSDWILAVCNSIYNVWLSHQLWNVSNLKIKFSIFRPPSAGLHPLKTLAPTWSL